MALLILSFLLPFFILVTCLIKLTSSGPAIYKQKRMGKDKKIFTIYKFRTMVREAEYLKSGLRKKNELSWPFFKMKDDPRFTWLGKILSRFGIDELPQLINIAKGDMAFVGPRPFPVAEAKKIPKKYDSRYKVLPGLTAPWVLQGFHSLSMDQWMELDCKYAKNRNVISDVSIFVKTIILLLRH